MINHRFTSHFPPNRPFPPKSRAPLRRDAPYSCTPTAVQSFLGSRLQLRAAVDISPGDELTISYIDCLATRQQRRRKLQVTGRHAFAFHNRF